MQIEPPSNIEGELSSSDLKYKIFTVFGKSIGLNVVYYGKILIFIKSVDNVLNR